MALVDGHGNFGSIEGDGAAAMRYTEAKLKKFTQEVYLSDLDKDVVDFISNFDETEKEPEVLPVRVPNILINGAEGIAVGMTTSVPTHNLGEVLDAVIAYMKNNNITTEELMEHVIGPDFPTGGLVVNKSDLKDIYENGTGKLKLRGKVVLEEGRRKSDKDKLVITEIPYTMVGANIGKFISDVCDLIENKKTNDITDISNESSKEGIRIVLELRKNADVEVLKNMLYKKTRLEDTFGVNMLSIVDGKPEVFGIKKIIEHNVKFQFELANRKYSTLLKKDLEQKEIKEGLIKACNIIDLIIEILRGSTSLKQAKECLISGNTENIKFKSETSKKQAQKLNFTEKQAGAILDLRLYRLIGLEILALQKDYDELLKRIAEYKEILSNKKAMAKVIIKDIEKIKKEYSIPRRTHIEDAKEAVYEENKIIEQEVVFLMDRFGYSKTIDIASYERNTEAIEAENKTIFRCMNTEKVCIFTDNGNLHQVKIIDVPFLKFREKGKPIDNLGNYSSKDEEMILVCPSSYILGSKLLFSTQKGMMKIVDYSEFDVIKRTVAATKLSNEDKVVSIKAINDFTLEYDDDIAPVMLSGGSDEGIYEEGDSQLSFNLDLENMPLPEAKNNFGKKMVVIQTKNGVFLRFSLGEVPEKKKGAVGVRGIKLTDGDSIENVYVLDAGDNDTVEFNGKKVELRKIKASKRDTKGTKIRC